MRVPFVVVLGGALVLAAASPSLAADPRPPSSADAALARRYYEDGVAAAGAKEWQKAYLAFAEAWKMKQHWQIAVNLGQAELRLGKYPDAAEHLAFYLREATELQPDDAKQAREWLDQAKAKVGILRINVAPKGAQVLVDGKPVGTAPLEHDTYVEGGWHVIEARTADAKAIKQVEAPLGRPIDVPIGVGGAVPAPLPGASVVATTQPATSVPSFGPRTTIAAGAGAFALVNLIIGAVEAGVSADKSGAQDKLCKPQCPQSRSVSAAWSKLEGERVGNANVSVAGFFIGGLALAGSIATFVLLPAKTAAPAPVASLRLSPAPGGAVISGSF